MTISKAIRKVKLWYARTFLKNSDKLVITRTGILTADDKPENDNCTIDVDIDIDIVDSRNQPLLNMSQSDIYETVSGVRFYLISRRRRNNIVRVKLLEDGTGKTVHMDEDVFLRLYRKVE